MYKDKIVCVVVPAYNEEESIGNVLDALPEYVDHVIVVDDGSTDETAKIAHEKHAFVLGHKRNKGVGAAFHTGVKKSLEFKTDVLVNIDADGQFDPKDIAQLIEPIMQHKSDVVTASRFLNKNLTPSMPRGKYWGNIAMARLISLLVGEKFHDVTCGFRAYSREALLRLNLLGTFTYTQETFLDLAYKGLVIKEVAVRVQGTRTHGESKVTTSLLRYAYRTLKIIFRAFRDYRPIRFFGAIAAFLFFLGVGMEIFMVIYWLKTGGFSPYKFVGVTGGFFMGMGSLIFVTGLLADMFYRIRGNQEEILYYKRKELFYKDET